MLREFENEAILNPVRSSPPGKARERLDHADSSVVPRQKLTEQRLAMPACLVRRELHAQVHPYGRTGNRARAIDNSGPTFSEAVAELIDPRGPWAFNTRPWLVAAHYRLSR